MEEILPAHVLSYASTSRSHIPRSLRDLVLREVERLSDRRPVTHLSLDASFESTGRGVALRFESKSGVQWELRADDVVDRATFVDCALGLRHRLCHDEGGGASSSSSEVAGGGGGAVPRMTA